MMEQGFFLFSLSGSLMGTSWTEILGESTVLTRKAYRRFRTSVKLNNAHFEDLVIH